MLSASASEDWDRARLREAVLLSTIAESVLLLSRSVFVEDSATLEFDLVRDFDLGLEEADELFLAAPPMDDERDELRLFPMMTFVLLLFK